MNEHHIYLLHIWTEEEEQDHPTFVRVALEEPRTGQRWGFTDMKNLAKFVEEGLIRYLVSQKEEEIPTC